MTLSFADGSLGTIHYVSSGHRGFPKERLTVFSQGRVLELDNFRRLIGHGFAGFSTMNLWRQDKGHGAEVSRFVERVAQGGEPLIPFDELWNVSLATLAAPASLAAGTKIVLDE
jgi:predicted dehydrogenase